MKAPFQVGPSIVMFVISVILVCLLVIAEGFSVSFCPLSFVVCTQQKACCSEETNSETTEEIPLTVLESNEESSDYEVYRCRCHAVRF